MSDSALHFVHMIDAVDIADQLAELTDEELIDWGDALVVAIHNNDASAAAAFVAGIQAGALKTAPRGEGAE